MEQKKTYVTPEIQVFEMQNQGPILSATTDGIPEESNEVG
jgi:hypothetical protein